MVLGKLETYMQKMKLDHFLTPHTRINSKWSKDLIRPKTIKLEEKQTINSDSALNNIYIYPWARETKEKMKKQDYI